jgi:predicted dehydrogenase
VAAGSRRIEAATAFVEEFGGSGARAHGTYEELVADPAVDVVYVASPHSEHRDHALLAIEAGKAVLVEKAFTRNASEAGEVLGAASRRRVFAMEAM